MNYRHLYHAGNFADVIKHILLTILLESLKRKDNPFSYIDTHGGAGFYDLFSVAAQKNKEYENGIEKIIASENLPEIVKPYVDCIHRINNKLTHTKYSSLQYYPGSPLIARYLLRAHDRIIACELETNAYQDLKKTFLGDKQVAIHHMDGFLGLKAFLPPPERRGLILIDPPYENPDEFTHIAQMLPLALKRFENGIYAIWYPLKIKADVQHFYRTLKNKITHPILINEISIFPELANHLNGCGMAIINPPWEFDNTMKDLLPWLWKTLSVNNAGEFKTYYL